MKRVIFGFLFMTTFSVHALETTPVDFSSPPTWKTGFVTFGHRTPLPLKQWVSGTAQEANLLGLYPGMTEPKREREVNGVIQLVPEPQTIFVARSTFVVEKPISQINIQNLATIDSIEKIDPTAKHVQISVNQLYKPSGQVLNQHPTKPWCSASDSLCVQSRWDNFPNLVLIALRLQKDKDPFQVTQSEVSLVPSTDLPKFAPLIGATPTAAMEQSIFYVNQFVRWGKNVILLSKGENDSTNVTVFSTVGIASRHYDMKILNSTLGSYLVEGLPLSTCKSGLVAGIAKLSSCVATNIREILKNQ